MPSSSLWGHVHVCICVLDLWLVYIRQKLFAGRAHLTSSAVSPDFYLLFFDCFAGSPHWLIVRHPSPSQHSYEYFRISRGWLIKLHCLMRSFCRWRQVGSVYQISACGRLASVSLWLESYACQLVKREKQKNKNGTMGWKIFNIYRWNKRVCGGNKYNKALIEELDAEEKKRKVWAKNEISLSLPMLSNLQKVSMSRESRLTAGPETQWTAGQRMWRLAWTRICPPASILVIKLKFCHVLSL